jgi:hypothetical protein
MSLTGQDIAEAQGALASLLGDFLAPHGISTNEFITMRVIVVRGKDMTPDQMVAFLASQRQLGLDQTAAAALLRGMEDKGWVAGDGKLTEAGRETFERLNALVNTLTPKVFAGFDPSVLETAHNVMRQVIVNAGALREQLVTQAASD